MYRLRKNIKAQIGLKLELMMEFVESRRCEWNTESIGKNQRDMIELLIEDLNGKACS